MGLVKGDPIKQQSSQEHQGHLSSDESEGDLGEGYQNLDHGWKLPPGYSSGANATSTAQPGYPQPQSTSYKDHPPLPPSATSQARPAPTVPIQPLPFQPYREASPVGHSISPHTRTPTSPNSTSPFAISSAAERERRMQARGSRRMDGNGNANGSANSSANVSPTRRTVPALPDYPPRTDVGRGRRFSRSTNDGSDHTD